MQKERSIMYKSIRDFFDSRDYLEVFTPTLSPDLIPEPTIQNFETTSCKWFSFNLSNIKLFS